MVRWNSLHSFYTSKEWIDLKALLMSQRVNQEGELLCEHCSKPILRKYDCIPHHIIELTLDNMHNHNISLNPDNILLLHLGCHNTVHDRFRHYTQKVYVVWGSPCAGKSTLVKQSSGQKDIIVDIDRLWSCISNVPEYVKPDALKSNVFGLYDQLLDMIKVRRGKWRNAWIVTGAPLLMDRKRLAQRLGAEEIHVDTDRETCLERCIDRPKEWIKYIEDYWDKYQPDTPG